MMNFINKIGRELRNREIQIFLFALALGSAAITAPALLAERLESGVRTYSVDLLGADAELSSSVAVDEELLQPAREAGLEESRSLRTTSIIVKPDTEKFQLARLRAVDELYPLKGVLLAKFSSEGEPQISSPPKRGEIWLEEFLALLLDAKLGDSIAVGEAELKFSAYLVQEPGRASFFSFAPRAMINLQDISATGLAIAGSRLRYRYLWSGDTATLNEYLDNIKPLLQVNQRITQANDEDASFSDILRRLRAFLLLSGSLCIILTSFALLLCMRHFIERNRRYVALLKTIGYTPRRTLLYLWSRIIPPAVIAYLVGCVGGWLGYKASAYYLQSILPPAEKVLSITPFLISAVSAVICLLAFALPSLWKLAALPPAVILRPSSTASSGGRVMPTIIAFVGIFALLLFYSRDPVISLGLFGAVLGLILLMGLVGYALLKLLHDRVGRNSSSVTLKIAVVSLYRSWNINSFQILSFAAAFMLIGVLTIMRLSFISDWQNDIQPDTPNYFLVNIAPNKVEGIQNLLDENNVKQGVFAGMVRGKLTHVEDEPLIERTKRLGTYDNEAEREFNLGWGDELPEHNQLIEGSWWQDGAAKSDAVDTFPISVEEEIAKDFNIELGMKLEFVVGGRKIYGIATSLRRVDWGDFKPNFYVLFPSDALQDFPRTFITSFFLPSEQKDFLLNVVRDFPTFSIISVERILAQLESILALVSNAMQLVLLLSLLSAIAVFVAALQVSIDSRSTTTATLRLLGETSRQALIHNLLEFCFIGFIAGILAVLGSEIIVWAVYEYLLQQSFVAHYYFWLLCPLISTILAGLIGFIWSRRAIMVPPRDLLRRINTA